MRANSVRNCAAKISDVYKSLINNSRKKDFELTLLIQFFETVMKSGRVKQLGWQQPKWPLKGLAFMHYFYYPCPSWAIASNFLRGALNFCFLLRSCTAWRTDSIWDDYHSTQMYNTVCWPKQSVSVPFALYIKKNCISYSMIIECDML